MTGIGDIIFKPVIQKGAGGLAFEKELALDINNYLNGVETNKLKHGDVLKEMEKILKFNRKEKYKVLEEGSKNQKRKISFTGSKLDIQNSDGPTLTDLTLVDSKNKKMYLSLKMSSSYYTLNAAVGEYFARGGIKIKINEYFGFDGKKMVGFGKQFACVTKKPNYSKVARNLEDILAVAVGTNVILIHKKTTNNVLVSVNKNQNKVAISGLDADSYGYPEKMFVSMLI
jgi:hypothetical protein